MQPDDWRCCRSAVARFQLDCRCLAVDASHVVAAAAAVLLAGGLVTAAAA